MVNKLSDHLDPSIKREWVKFQEMLTTCLLPTEITEIDNIHG